LPISAFLRSDGAPMSTPCPDSESAGGAPVPAYTPPAPRRRRRWPGVLGRSLLRALLTGAAVWGSAALWIDGPAARWAAGLLAAAFLITACAALWAVRPFRRGVLIGGGLFLVVLVWWLSIPPRNDRDWTPDVARLSSADI